LFPIRQIGIDNLRLSVFGKVGHDSRRPGNRHPDNADSVVIDWSVDPDDWGECIFYSDFNLQKVATSP
jgi:hypothetical protein